MEKIAEFDKEIIATVCGSFRRGIDNGLLLSDDCNNPEADPGVGLGGLLPPFTTAQAYNFQVSLPKRFVSLVFFFVFLTPLLFLCFPRHSKQ